MNCKHGNCGCPLPSSDTDFCSEYCSEASACEPPAGACSCGHGECVEAQRTHPAGENEVKTAVGTRG